MALYFFIFYFFFRAGGDFRGVLETAEVLGGGGGGGGGVSVLVEARGGCFGGMETCDTDPKMEECDEVSC